MKRKAPSFAAELVEELWGEMFGIWGLGNENGDDETLCISEDEFKKIALRVSRRRQRRQRKAK